MVGMIDVLRQEHNDVARLLDLVDAQINGKAPLDLDLLHEVLEYCLTYPDQYHHPKEDLIYRALCAHDQRVEPVIEDLEAEHEELAVLTREFATLVEKARADGTHTPLSFKELGQSFLDFYRQHMTKEEQWFFPDALKMLAPEEWSDLEAEVSDPTDPLFREKSADRLRSLLDRASV